MVSKSNQSGYVFVLLLGWLGVLGAGLMVGYGYSHHNQSIWRALWQDAQQLNDERERLLFYSVDYVNLYGHGGAGPGHLPCPDTDEGATRPGPNPPCGNAYLAMGRLPDGVSRAVGRIAFSDSLHERSEYTVVNSVVNNPAQAISVHQWPQETEFTTTAKGYALLQRPSGQERVLNRTAIEPATWRWVRAWFVTEWLATQFIHCQKDSGQTPLANCAASGSDNALTLPVEHCLSDNPLCQIAGADLLNWWLAPSAADWQGVPVTQHWFVKNGWLQAAAFEWHRECVEPNRVCGLYISDDPHTLQISLLPQSNAQR